MKSDANPMQSAHAAPRCTAHSKHSGFLCKNPSVDDWAVCRMPGAGGRAGCCSAHPNYRNGLRTLAMWDVGLMIAALRSFEGCQR